MLQSVGSSLDLDSSFRHLLLLSTHGPLLLAHEAVAVTVTVAAAVAVTAAVAVIVSLLALCMQGCTSALAHDAPQQQPVTLCGDDACQICWDPLSASPAIMLDCKHTCHLACAQDHLKQVSLFILQHVPSLGSTM